MSALLKIGAVCWAPTTAGIDAATARTTKPMIGCRICLVLPKLVCLGWTLLQPPEGNDAQHARRRHECCRHEGGREAAASAGNEQRDEPFDTDLHEQHDDGREHAEAPENDRHRERVQKDGDARRWLE